MLNLHLQKRVKCDRLSGFFLTNLRHSSQFEKYPHLINLSKTVKSKNVKAGKTELIELKGSPAPGIFSKPLDVNTLFGDPEKSGYLKPDTRPFRVRAMDVIRHLPTELKLRAAHISRNFRPFSGYIEGVERHNDHMYLPNSNFRELSDEEFAQWQTLCDSDWNEGYSRVELVRTRGTRTALFRGNYCTRIPRTGDVRQTGYVGLFSPTYKSGLFSYQDYWLKCFTHLVIRYRGDGRTYLLQLHCPSYIDLTQFDTWSTYLYTRGGPYWQVAKIPFASFIFQVRGSIQDRQQSPPLHEVQRWSVVLKDRVDGPFALEIDYMGAMFDAFHDRTLRWEMYPFNRL